MQRRGPARLQSLRPVHSPNTALCTPMTACPGRRRAARARVPPRGLGVRAAPEERVVGGLHHGHETGLEAPDGVVQDGHVRAVQAGHELHLQDVEALQVLLDGLLGLLAVLLHEQQRGLGPPQRQDLVVHGHGLALQPLLRVRHLARPHEQHAADAHQAPHVGGDVGVEPVRVLRGEAGLELREGGQVALHVRREREVRHGLQGRHEAVLQERAVDVQRVAVAHKHLVTAAVIAVCLNEIRVVLFAVHDAGRLGLMIDEVHPRHQLVAHGVGGDVAVRPHEVLPREHIGAEQGIDVGLDALKRCLDAVEELGPCRGGDGGDGVEELGLRFIPSQRHVAA
mmetsp:Transcript_71055/g.118817  ORF Transcript_71055/g.118817 Transcript_71055/m.118817 type:complete len:339 (+) Transcript_71055:642-1658(+)